MFQLCEKVQLGQGFPRFANLSHCVLRNTLQHQKFVLEIIDKGTPIGQEELDLMFNKLRTLNDASNSFESRLGLGLSIAKLMAQDMGGDLTYRSDDDGNYFRVEFNVIS